MLFIQKCKPIWLLAIVFIFGSNIMLYHTSVGATILPEQTQQVVLGSMFDFIISLPIAIMLYRNQFSIKSTIILIASGCIAARLLIPLPLLAPYEAITWIGFLIEGSIFIFELLLIITFVRFMPNIIRDVKQNQLPLLFAFAQSVSKFVKGHLLIQIMCSELLMFYYAVASWKKPIPTGITLYKNTSFIALQVMLVHAIVVETIGVHYWLHDKAPILSIILLVINIYSVLFFLGDLQALRLTPIFTKNDTLYLSLGLMKRAEINYANIEELIEDPAMLERKKPKDTADFVVRDFEKVYPDILLKMKQPQKVTGFMGIEKEFDYIAIKSDQPDELKRLIQERLT